MKNLMDEQKKYRPDYLIDILIEKADLDNDSALARALEINPVRISHIRHKRRPITPDVLMRMHEVFGYSMDKLREWAGMKSWRKACSTTSAI